MLLDQKQVDAPPTPITEDREQKNNGNEFKVYCSKVADIQIISQVRTYLVRNKPDVPKASHIIYGYRQTVTSLRIESRWTMIMSSMSTVLR